MHHLPRHYLQEYLQDYADSDLRKKGEELIAREMSPDASEPLSYQVRPAMLLGGMPGGVTLAG